MILEDKVSKDIKGKRELQLAELRKWERKINSICSDPAKLCVENIVDLAMPPMEFVYINECRVRILWLIHMHGGISKGRNCSDL